MKQPRYSIIPGGAVTDPRLEGRDLQVLCLLGRHSDKLGWVYRSQVEMAEELDCARSTLQLSLGRLVQAGWIENKATEVSKNGRSYAVYAYRVRMDRDDPELGPEQSEVEGQDRDGGADLSAPPADLSAGCRPMDRQGVPIHTSAQRGPRDQDSGGGMGARARELLVSEKAVQTAETIASIAGYPDPKAWPPGWCGSPMRVQAFLNEGYHPQHLLAGAREVMAANPSAKAWSIEYFAKAFSRARGRAEAPVPSPTTADPSNGTVRDRNGTPRPGSREDRQEQTANALRQLREFAYGPDSDGQERGGEAGRPLLDGLPPPEPA